MEAARYHNRDRRSDVQLAVTNKTLPGILVLVLGLCIVIAGIILFAAYGLPDNVSQNPKTISGPITVSAGVLVCLLGAFITRKLRIQKQAVSSKRHQRLRNDVAQIVPHGGVHITGTHENNARNNPKSMLRGRTELPLALTPV